MKSRKYPSLHRSSSNGQPNSIWISSLESTDNIIGDYLDLVLCFQEFHQFRCKDGTFLTCL